MTITETRVMSNDPQEAIFAAWKEIDSPEGFSKIAFLTAEYLVKVADKEMFGADPERTAAAIKRRLAAARDLNLSASEYLGSLARSLGTSRAA